MLTTLVLAAAMTAPAIAPVNFVHGYKQNDKLTYVMKLGSPDEGFEMSMTFDLTIGDSKEGKTNATIKVTDVDMEGLPQGAEMPEMPEMEIVLNKNGTPVFEGTGGPGMQILMALTTTYLPNKPLDVGDEFDFKIENEEFEMTSKGKFAGMEKVDGEEYAVLQWEAQVESGDGDNFTMKTKTYYDPSSKRVERTTSEIDTRGGLLNLSLTMKK